MLLELPCQSLVSLYLLKISLTLFLLPFELHSISRTDEITDDNDADSSSDDEEDQASDDVGPSSIPFHPQLEVSIRFCWS